LAVILIILLIIWYPYQNKKNRTIERTIAVLPFHDDSPEKDNEYFCNGMMEEILNHLQKIGDLQVKSRTSVEQYRNPMRDIKAIGKELQVAFLVEGSVRKFGDDLRITAQLIETNSGNHLWSEIYDGKYTDEIFDFQSEVAKRIAASLDAAITPEEELSIEKLPTSNIEAYDYYRRANYEGQLYWKTHDFEHLRRSHELLDKALEIDPLYKWAIAQKGDVFISEGLYDSALAYANRVLDIDPKFAWGYGVKGEYYRYTGVSDLAIENYMTAIDYYGSEYMEQGKWYEFLIGTVYCQQKNDYRKGLPYLQNGFDINGEQGGSECHILGMIFSDIGDYERSEKYYRKMLMLEPGGNCIGASFYATVLLFQSKIDEVLDLLDLLCKQHECWWVCNKIKFYTYTTLKEFDEAERSYNQFITDGGIPSRMDSIWLGYLYKQTGRDQKAFTVLTYTRNTLEKQMKSSKYWFLYFNLSSTYALLDAKEKALEYLAESVNIGLKLGFHDFLNMDPVFESYRDDPGFKAILKKAQEDKAATREIIKNMEEQGELDL
jgi:TolB-like protein